MTLASPLSASHCKAYCCLSASLVQPSSPLLKLSRLAPLLSISSANCPVPAPVAIVSCKLSARDSILSVSGNFITAPLRDSTAAVICLSLKPVDIRFDNASMLESDSPVRAVRFTSCFFITSKLFPAVLAPCSSLARSFLYSLVLSIVANTAVAAPVAAVVYAANAFLAVSIDVLTAFAPVSAALKLIFAASFATFLHTFIAGSSFSLIAPAFFAASSNAPFTEFTAVCAVFNFDVTGSSFSAMPLAFDLSSSNFFVTFCTADNDDIFSLTLSTDSDNAIIFLFSSVNSFIFF